MVIAVDQLSDSDVGITVHPWVNASGNRAAMCRMLEETKITFDANGVTIPYSQRDVYSFQSAHAHR